MTTSEALTDLYVRESGTPGAPAIVFLHADGASGGMWDQQRVVIDGCGVLPAREAGLWKLGMALIAPFIHRKLVISVLYRALGGDPGDPAGRAGLAADLRAVPGPSEPPMPRLPP